LASALKLILLEHRMRCGRSQGLVFGDGSAPFDDRRVVERAKKEWKAAKLAGIGLHESRHTFASLMIAAGVNAKALSTYLGHASVTITYDRYGHLMPGNEDEAAALLDKLLSGPNTGPKVAETAS
jgi:integrase